MAKRDKVTSASEVKEAAPKVEPKIDFGSWYYSKAVPTHHYKEIVWADFQARGLSEYETKETFDKALKLYGLNI